MVTTSIKAICDCSHEMAVNTEDLMNKKEFTCEKCGSTVMNEAQMHKVRALLQIVVKGEEVPESVDTDDVSITKVRRIH